MEILEQGSVQYAINKYNEWRVTYLGDKDLAVYSDTKFRFYLVGNETSIGGGAGLPVTSSVYSYVLEGGVYGWANSFGQFFQEDFVQDLLPQLEQYILNQSPPGTFVDASIWLTRNSGYYFNFPSWAPVPEWYHWATLIKADGTTLGKEIAVTREAPGLPFTMEVWRKDPDPSEIYDYYPKQFLMDSNLLDELEFPLEPSAELAEIGGGEVTPIIFYPWLSEPATDQQFTPAQLEAATTDPETGELIFDPDPDGGDIMPDSLLMKKVAAAVEADRYGVHPTNPDAPNLNNLGRLIEAIGYLLGINLDADGKNIPYPDPEYLTPEQVKEISHLKTSQFAAFDGAKGMQVASLYDIRANMPVKDSFGKTVIQPGGAVKTWNLAQFLDQMADDTEAQLGGAALASLQVPAGDGKSYIQYEGLGHAIQDCLFMLSVESKRVDELVIQSARTIHLLQQVLMGLGLPMRPDTIDFLVGAETATAENPPKQAVAPVASLDPSGPTLASLAGIILANLSRLVAGSIGYQTTEINAKANTDTADPFNFEEDPTPGLSDI